MKKRLWILALLSAWTFGGCGGGGSDGGSGASSGSSAPVTVKGAALDGPVSGATVTVKNADGSVIAGATAKTLADGTYSVSVPGNQPMPWKIEVGTDGVDTVTGETIPFTMTTLVTSASQTTANASPLTTLVTAAVENAVGGLSLVKATDVTSMSSQMIKQLGFGVDGENSQIDLITTPVTAAVASSVAMASEALGEMARRTARSVTGTGGTTVTPARVLQLLGEDMSDGYVDGKKRVAGVASAVSTSDLAGISVDKLIAVVQVQAAQVATEVVSNQLSVTKNSGAVMSASEVKTALATALAATVNAVEGSKVSASDIAIRLAALPVSSALKQQGMTGVDSVLVLDKTNAAFVDLKQKYQAITVGSKASEAAQTLTANVLATTQAAATTILTNAVSGVLVTTGDLLGQLQGSSATAIAATTTSTNTGAVNRAPVASGGSLSITKNTSFSGLTLLGRPPQAVTASDPDGDALTYSIVTNGSKGSATFINPTSGAITYTPNTNITGTDSFTFKVSDGKLSSNVATVTVTIVEPPSAAPPVSTSKASDTLLGTWYSLNDAWGNSGVITFLSDGTYVHAETGPTDGGGFTGVELGSYSWDAATGKLAATKVEVDTNGTWGLSDSLTKGPGIVKFNGDVATYTDSSTSATDPPSNLIRLVSDPSNALVGSWYATDANKTYSVVVTFFNNGYYFLAEKNTVDPNVTNGVEFGTYKWNASTGVLSVGLIVDTNGQGGASHPVGTDRIIISGNSFVASDDSPGSTTFVRVAPVSGGSSDPVSSPPTGNTQPVTNVTNETLANNPSAGVVAAEPVVQFTTASLTNYPGDKVAVPFSLSKASSVNVSVPFTIAGTAKAGTDYALSTTSPVTVPAGTLGGMIDFTALSGGGKTMILTLGNPTYASVGTIGTLTVTLNDKATTTTTVTGSAPLPRTGQTTCSDPTGTTSAAISCGGTGQDGALQKGVAWPTPRFTDNGNGTVTDNLTGLIWLKNANCFDTQTWANALTSANTLASGACGLTDSSKAGDWRLPNKVELKSLVDRSQISPALPSGHPFSGVQSNYYWSSSSYATSGSVAWYVYLDDGFVNVSTKSATTYVWPVRGGQ
ncbi:MAG: DUF1566 domain-containing protein [Magnetococcales bacterium]|nr:DUF1566 domain-containing protein [Magnetococcales bacterium]